MSLQEREVDDLLRRQEIHAIGTMMCDRELERARIAKDLHDRLGSMISAAKLQFSMLGSRMDISGSDQGRHYENALELLDQVVDEVRRISRELSMSSASRFGLKHALEDLRGSLHALNILEVEMSVYGLDEGTEHRFDMAAYRIVQQCVSNVLKHAQASTLTVQLTRSSAGINILVEDNGRGFDPASANEGAGMTQLRQHVMEFDGIVNIDSRPGRGTTVNIDIPLKRTPNDNQ